MESLSKTPRPSTSNAEEYEELEIARNKREDVNLDGESAPTQSVFVIDHADKRSNTNITGTIRPVQSSLGGADKAPRFLKLRKQFLVSGVLHASAPLDTIFSTAAQTIYSYEVPANTISRNDSQIESCGNIFRIYIAGTIVQANATDYVTYSFKINNTTVHTAATPSGASLTNVPYNFTWTVAVPSTGASGGCSSHLEGAINNVGKDSGVTSSTSIDTTDTITFSVSADWDATVGDPSGDYTRRNLFIVELLN